ncbi:hypothetical protein ABIA38_007192 [Embleya sp. AB8]
MAFDGPIRRGRRWVPPAPGMMPSVISGWPSFAVSAHRADSQPPPSAKPVIAATTGLGISATAVKEDCNPVLRSAMSV